MATAGTDQIEPDAPARRARRFPWWAWTLVAIALVTALVAALGGFREVPIEKLPAIALGEPHEGNEYRTTINAVYLTDRLPNTGHSADEGFEYLVVEATVENLANTPGYNLTRKLLRVLLTGVIDPDGPGSDPQVSDPRYGDPVGYLQPGLPITVLYSWEVETGKVANGDDIVVGIFERHFDDSNPAFDDYSTTDAVARVITQVGAGT